MTLFEWLALGILILTLAASRLESGRSLFLRSPGRIFAASVAAVFGAALYSTYLLYEGWRAGALTRFFLPPYSGWGYFYSTAGYRFFVPWLISLTLAIAVSRLAERGNRHLGERFFEPEEIGIMRLSFFLVGYPGVWFYAILILLAGTALSAVYTALARGRAPLYYFWLPLAIATILMQKWLIPVRFVTFFNL